MFTFGVFDNGPKPVEYVDCVFRSSQNPAMSGYSVRLSGFVANVCLAILITCKDQSAEDAALVVLLPIYTMLACTFISMARKRLSVADAHFASTITFSPLSFYLIYASLRDIFWRKNAGIFRDLESTPKLDSKSDPKSAPDRHVKHIIRFLSLFLVVGWVILDILIYAAPTIVFAGNGCGKTSFKDWLFYDITVSEITLTYSVTVGLPALFCVFVIYAIRHLRDIRDQYIRTRQGGPPRWVPSLFYEISIMIRSQWQVITGPRPWLIFLMVSLFYLTWGSSLLLWVPDMRVYYVKVLESLEPGTSVSLPQTDYDPLGFGQLLAASVAVQPLYSIVRLLLRKKCEICKAIISSPRSMWREIKFIFTGRDNPWHKLHAAKIPPPLAETKVTSRESSYYGRPPTDDLPTLPTSTSPTASDSLSPRESARLSGGPGDVRPPHPQ